MILEITGGPRPDDIQEVVDTLTWTRIANMIPERYPNLESLNIIFSKDVLFPNNFIFSIGLSKESEKIILDILYPISARGILSVNGKKVSAKLSMEKDNTS